MNLGSPGLKNRVDQVWAMKGFMCTSFWCIGTRAYRAAHGKNAFLFNIGVINHSKHVLHNHADISFIKLQGVISNQVPSIKSLDLVPISGPRQNLSLQILVPFITIIYINDLGELDLMTTRHLYTGRMIFHLCLRTRGSEASSRVAAPGLQWTNGP